MKLKANEYCKMLIINYKIGFLLMLFFLSNCSLKEQMKIGNIIGEFYGASYVTTTVGTNADIKKGNTKDVTFNLTFSEKPFDNLDIVFGGATKIAYENFNEKDKQTYNQIKIIIKVGNNEFSKAYELSQVKQNIKLLKTTDLILDEIKNQNFEKINKRYSAYIDGNSKIILKNVILKIDSLYGKAKKVQFVGLNGGWINMNESSFQGFESWYLIEYEKGKSFFKIIINSDTKEIISLTINKI
jgi:hypothetical protein